MLFPSRFIFVDWCLSRILLRLLYLSTKSRQEEIQACQHASSWTGENQICWVTFCGSIGCHPGSTPTNLLPSFRFTWLDDGTKHFRVNSFLTVTKFKSILEEYFNECNNYRNPIQPSPGIFSSWEVSKEVASSLECQEVNFLQEKLVRGNLSFSSKSGNRQKLIDNSFPGWAFPFSRRKNDRLRFLSWLKREITWNSQWCDAIKENLGLKNNILNKNYMHGTRSHNLQG